MARAASAPSSRSTSSGENKSMLYMARSLGMKPARSKVTWFAERVADCGAVVFAGPTFVLN